MEMSVSIHQANEPVAVLSLEGEIDASNFMPILEKAQEIYGNPATNLILDLSQVPYISSAGLVAIHKIALVYSGVPHQVHEDAPPDFTHNSSARRHVKLLNPQPRVDQVLETAGLKLFFKVYHDLESALKSF